MLSLSLEEALYVSMHVHSPKDMMPCSFVISCRRFRVYFRAVTDCHSYSVVCQKTPAFVSNAS